MFIVLKSGVITHISTIQVTLLILLTAILVGALLGTYTTQCKCEISLR